MRVILWTPRARGDLAAIRAFIEQDSPQVPLKRNERHLMDSAALTCCTPKIGNI